MTIGFPPIYSILFICLAHKLTKMVFAHCRFFSIGERLACSCGSSRCRGIVNDIEAEERMAKLYVPSSELKDWKGE